MKDWWKKKRLILLIKRKIWQNKIEKIRKEGNDMDYMMYWKNKMRKQRW